MNNISPSFHAVFTATLISVFVSLFVDDSVAEEPLTFRTDEKSAWRIAISPDSSSVFTASHANDRMRRWDLKTKKLVGEYRNIWGGLSSIECSPDGKYVLTGSFGDKVRLWDIETGKLHRAFTIPAKPVTCVAFSPDGKMIAAVVKDHRLVYIYETATGKEVRTLKADMAEPVVGSGGLSQVCFSPDGKLLLAACGGKGHPKYTGGPSVICLWATATWEVKTSFRADDHNVYRLTVSPDGKMIAAACHRGHCVKLWKISERSDAVTEKPDDATIARLIADLNAEAFAAREEAQAKLIEIGEPAEKALEIVAEDGEIEAQFRARTILKSLTESTAIKPWKVLPLGQDAHAVAFSPDGKFIATGGKEPKAGNFTLWDAKTFIPTELAGVRGTWAINYTPNGKQVLTGNSDGSVTVWDAATLSE